MPWFSQNDHQTTSSCSPSSTSSSPPSSSTSSVPSNIKLTRQKKIRHLPDKNFSLHIVKNPPPPSPDSLPKEETTTSHTLPVPELASLLRRDGYALSSRQFSDYRLPSPNSSSSRSVKKDHGGVDQRLPEQTSRNSMERQAKCSGRKVPQKLEPLRTTQNDYMFNFPHKSAPSSPYSSPRISTQRHSSAADMFLSNYATSQKSQGWSAPEMQSGRYSGYTPQISRDTSPFHENPHFHSPLAKSPQKSSRISTSPTSPSNHILSSDVPISPFASNRNHDLPLPLPPGVASTSQAGPSPQIVAKPEIFPIPNQWQKGKLIGRGTFGSVYVATNLQTGALCAMKEVELFPDDPKSAECIKQLEKEIKLLSQLKHPNIVQYYGSEIVGEKLHIFLEYVHPGSISKYVQDHCGAITESVVRNFTRHILSGLAYLHSTWTIHRDIKGANLLVDASGVVKLADFGMAKHLSGQAANLSLKGSPYWMAPELIHAVMQKDMKSDLAYAVDVWSLGCTIIEMLNGKPPWSEYEGAAAMFKVLRETPTIPENLSPEGKDFLHCCFRRNPAERPTAGRLLEHRFLRNSQHFDVQSCVLGLDAMNFQENCFPALEQDKVFSPRRLSNSNLYQLPLLSPTRTSTPQSTSVRHYTLSPVNMADNLILRLPG